MKVRIALLNLMPFKLVTEGDFRRVLRSSECDIELTLLRIASHTPTHTPVSLLAEYKDIYAVEGQSFDGMLITGAPVEHLPYEDVTYWEELTYIFRWAEQHVRSTIYICWAAQAALYMRYGIEKYGLAMKMFGVFPQTILNRVPLLEQFDDPFMMPHSRHTQLRKGDLLQHSDLLPLAENEQTGVSILLAHGGRDLYVMGHFEYPAGTLNDEYLRDKGKRADVGIPQNYYIDDDPSREYIGSWTAMGKLFYQNWIKYYLLSEK